MERAENTRNTATAERVVRTTRPPGRSGGGSLTDTDQDVVKACLASRSSRCSAGLTDTARDAAGYLLTLLATSAALVLAREQRDRGVRRGARVDRLPWLGR